MDNHPFNKRSFLSKKVLQSLQSIPTVAAMRGRGVAMLQGEKVKYFPLNGRQRLPQRFINILLDYKPKTQVLIVGSLRLDEKTPYMVFDVPLVAIAP